MTGLRSWIRDPELPARGGQPELTPLDENTLRRLLEEHVLLPGAAPPDELSWEYARWKPGVSITCTYRLHWKDGTDELLVVKRYADDKARHLAERKDRSEQIQRFYERVRPRVVLPERSLAAWCPAGDRELPGVAQLLDVKRFAKIVRDSGIAPPGMVRRRKSVYELLRYKAERRAVFRARLKLRDEARTRISLAARVLPPDKALWVARARTALEERLTAAAEGPTVPRLRGGHDRYGIVLEEWLDIEASPLPGDFSRAAVAGATLARLHRLPPPPADSVPSLPYPQGRALLALFAIRQDLASSYLGLHAPPPASRSWVHGDFHADQCVRDRSGAPVLLDLDELALGDPARDLASWIADVIYEAPQTPYEDASGSLLEGYASQSAALPDPAHLRRLTADALVCRAAAAIRRLERDAPDRALRSLDAAAAVTPHRPSRP